MKNFLNNLSWFISFAFSFWFFSSFLWNEDWVAFWLWIIFWFLIKWIFLSENNIQISLEKFYENILKNIKNEDFFKENKIWLKEEKIEKIEKIEKVEKVEEKNISKNFYEKNEAILSVKDKSIPSFEEMLENEKEIQKSFKKEETIKKEKQENQIFSTLKWEFEKTEVWNNLSKFFKENLLAKIWAIFLLIWVWFLMMLIWNEINDATKIILWFLIWFSCYFSWIWLDKRKFIWESRILMWIGIWINFLVILAWRYLFSYWFTDNENLSIILTFLGLILNTIFWIFTSLKYKNKNLLIFSFIFAYLNPLLLGTTSEDPYIFLVYTLFVTLSAIFIWEKVESKSLILLSFIIWNLFFLIAPTSNEFWFLAKITFSIVSSFVFINTKTTKDFENSEWSLLTNWIVFSPIVLQAILKNIEISEFSYIICFTYSIIIFWYFIWKAKKENQTEFLPIATGFVISLFLCLNFWDGKISIFTFIVSVALAFINIFSPFILEKLKNKEDLWNYSSSLVASSIFLIIWTFAFKNIFVENFSILWYIFTLYSIIYLVSWSFITRIFSIENYKKSEFKNIFIIFFSLFLSFFTIWIWLILNETSKLLLINIWLIEAFLVLVIFKLTEENKFRILSNIISSIWIFGLFVNLIFIPSRYDIWSIFFSIILILIFIWKIFLLKNKSSIYDYILHISWVSIWYLTLTKYLWNNDETIILSGIIFVASLWFLYKTIENKILKIFFIIIFSFAAFSQILYYLDEKNLGVAFVGILLFLLITAFYQVKKDENSLKINTIYSLFLFILSSIIVVELSNSHHSLWIYWWILWSLLILIWLNIKKIWPRTIWLYIICLMIWKIILSDIWLLNPILFLIIWPVLIAISILYTKYVWNDISKEFALDNIFRKNEEKILEKKDDIIDKILKTDVEEIESVSFIIEEKEFLKTKFKKIIQIMKFIENEKWKNNFEENELLDFYNNISEKYPQKLSDEERKKAESVLLKFAEKWWKIIFNKKS